jgi:DNA-binding transcriptional regulator GbsR (MarR family)
MPPPDPVELNPVVRRFVQEAGHLTQSLGVGRVVGQIYAYLYFTEGSGNLTNLQRALGISKGAASMGVRQLEQWGAVRKVWVRGDRKDYYEANDWFGQIVRNAVLDTIAKKISSGAALLDSAEDMVLTERGDGQFLRRRIKRLRDFQCKVQRAWNNPLLKRLLT